MAVHDCRVARHWHHLRTDPRASELEDRSDHDAEGEQRPIGHRLPPEQGALAARRGRSGAGARPADRLGAADPHRDGARPRRPWIRFAQRADDADVADGPAVREGRSRRRSSCATASSVCAPCRAWSSASATCCVPLAGRLRPAVPHRRPAAADGSVPRRRRLDDGVARLLRGVQDPGEAAAARSTSATTAHAPPVVIINEAMAKQFWPKAIR